MDRDSFKIMQMTNVSFSKQLVYVELAQPLLSYAMRMIMQ